MNVPTRSLFGRLLAGFGAQGFSIVVRLAQQIIMVPLFLGAWSATVYQEWLILVAATSFLGLLDLGLHYYLANQLLISWSAGDAAGFQRIFHLGLGIYVRVIAIAVAIVAPVAWLAAASGWLDFGATGSPSVFIAIMGMATYTLIAMPSGVANSIYWARGHVARGINFATGFTVLETIAVAAALWLEATPAMVALVYAGASCLLWLCLWLDHGRCYPELGYRTLRPKIGDYVEILPKAIDYLIVPAAMSATLQGSLLILGSVAGAAANAPVVLFATLRTLANLARQIVAQTGHVACAEMTRFYAAGDRAQLVPLYEASARLLGGVGGLLAGGLVVVAPLVITIWTRGKVGYEPWTFLGLLAGIVLTLPGQLAMLQLFASNQARALTLCMVVQAAAGCALAIPGAHFWGAAGVAWALALTECLTVGLLPWQLGRTMGLPILRPMLTGYAAAAAGAAASFAGAKLAVALCGGSRLSELALAGVVWCALVALPAFHIMLGDQHRQRARGWLGSVARSLTMRRP
ncbi:MAG: hypothetical protein FJX35_15700 [Alphaproteobacteria bacterium]|nr:hypothetical protein [Alphaproteobacteria bacterium]